MKFSYFMGGCADLANHYWRRVAQTWQVQNPPFPSPPVMIYEYSLCENKIHDVCNALS